MAVSDWTEGKVVRAAGGIVLRPTDAGSTRVALVHRPRYDDWSFPKGKLLPEEGEVAAAIREVLEETGFRCEPLRPLPQIRYVDSKGRPKVVSYWVMRPVEGEFAPNSEVDELRWVPLGLAAEMLTYRHDRELLRQVGTEA